MSKTPRWVHRLSVYHLERTDVVDIRYSFYDAGVVIAVSPSAARKLLRHGIMPELWTTDDNVKCRRIGHSEKRIPQIVLTSFNTP